MKQLENLDILGNGYICVENTAAAFKLWRQRLGYFSLFAALPVIFAAPVSGLKGGASRVDAAGEINNSIDPDRRARQRPGTFLMPHRPKELNFFSGGGDNCYNAVYIPPGNYIGQTVAVYGDTTGANDSVSLLDGGFYYSYSVSGPDLFYTFTLTGRGANPTITLTADSTGYYSPAIYLLDGSYCPDYVTYGWYALAFGPTPTIYLNYINNLPLNVPIYLLVDSYGSQGSGGSGAYTLRFSDVNIKYKIRRSTTQD